MKSFWHCLRSFRKYLKRSISTQSDGDLPNATPVITVELLTKPKPERTDSHSENKSNVDEPETTISSADRKTTIKLQDFARSQGESMLDRFKDSKKGAGLCRSLSERHESIRSQLEAGKTSIKLSRSLSERHEASKSLLDSVGEQRDVSELTEEDAAMLLMDNRSGVHFLTEDQASSLMYPNVETSGADGAEENEAMSLLRIRCKQELLEYVVRGDGRVVCKLCGEVLQSRTHWYRHKYKLHAHTPQGLFKCEHCSVFFKSRKGYIGHLSSRHPESDSGAAEASPSFSVEVLDIKQEPLDPEAVIPSCELPTTHCNKKLKTNKGAAAEGAVGEGVEWEQQRRREERLVADIIARVRRECEAAGAPGGARRGYSRRSALTNG